MTMVKICGCRSVEHARTAKEAGADFIGMVFAESRRKVSRPQASEIVKAISYPPSGRNLDSSAIEPRTDVEGLRHWFEEGATSLQERLNHRRPLSVGVFAKNDPDEINEIVTECGIDLIQLSGGEPWSQISKLTRPVIKVIHVSDEDDSSSVRSRIETGSAVAMMLDRASSKALGGTGQTFDWDTASEIAGQMPLWLAGGLTPENVASAISQVKPWCVDVSSGVETNGTKDLQKIRDFVGAAKTG